MFICLDKIKKLIDLIKRFISAQCVDYHMQDIADIVLLKPTKPEEGIKSRIDELNKYQSIAKAPPELINEIKQTLLPYQVLAVWMRQEFSGRSLVYSIEDSSSARSTSDIHTKDCWRYNPRLIKTYSAEELEKT